ncbi:DUF2087 domain containing protein [Sulfitobacter noctilucicola]|uniref:DUF2087 domain-containing protein n=1 Tax=Sulfitobacter noctilucicola TaxID=1342301 RepID=A0A7W6M6K6_9RHOB|nr:DUF2087 domain-containing protein [Sulfitobacter noctilucicola]KIN62425.1 DUF2087 domain containing protein [Sulfitobacter noctilucicola]MBB4173043.1 hypothetical protein [Sulfitobacter noctilucicola]
MSKECIPLVVADMSPFSRNLLKQLKESGDLPSHLGLLNMLARAAGFRNYQHLRASDTARIRLDTVTSGAVDYARIEKCLQQFDTDGTLVRWPSKRYVQELCLWVLWSHLPSDEVMQERQVNGVLNQLHRFDDAALLRRSLIGMKLVSRNPDGSDYRRIEQAPPPDALALIRAVSAKVA